MSLVGCQTAPDGFEVFPCRTVGYRADCALGRDGSSAAKRCSRHPEPVNAMSLHPEPLDSAAAAAPPGDPVQQGEAVPSRWLAEFEDDPEVARTLRILGDRNLLTTLQLEGFAGPVWAQARSELARYGLSVLTAWIATMTIFAKRQEKAFKPVLYPPTSGSSTHEALRDEAADVATMLVSESLGSFHDNVLLQGRWMPEKGASLTTYFIGWCLLQFNTVYRAWLVQRKHDAPVIGAVEFDLDRHDRGGLEDPARAVVALDTARRVLETAVGSSRRTSTRRQTATILPLLAAGHSQAEIAALLGTTERAVEGHLARLRKRLPWEACDD